VKGADIRVAPDTSQRDEAGGDRHGLLHGFKAIELGGVAGQMCGRVLTDLGVDVIKVEDPDGDPVRSLEPVIKGQSLKFTFLNSGKKSVVLDHRDDAGREALHSLASEVDLVIVSSSNSVLEAWDLDLDRLHEELPGLVIVSVTGFGREGPFADFAYHDILGMAMGGLMYVSGDPDGSPVTAPETQASYFAGVFAAQGAMLALYRRETDPLRRGALVDVTAQQALASIEQLIRIYGRQGRVPVRTGSQHKHVAPARVYPTKDGHVSLFVTDQHWSSFIETWPDHPPELDDPSLNATQERMARLDTIDKHVREYTGRYASEEFVERMVAAGVPCTPVNSLGEFLSDAQTEYRRLLGKVNQPGLGEVLQISFPPLLNGHRVEPRPAPHLGEHTEQILEGLGVRAGGSVREIET